MSHWFRLLKSDGPAADRSPYSRQASDGQNQEVPEFVVPEAGLAGKNIDRGGACVGAVRDRRRDRRGTTDHHAHTDSDDHNNAASIDNDNDTTDHPYEQHHCATDNHGGGPCTIAGARTQCSEFGSLAERSD